MNDSNDFKKFCLEHKGAIIGGLQLLKTKLEK